MRTARFEGVFASVSATSETVTPTRSPPANYFPSTFSRQHRTLVMSSRLPSICFTGLIPFCLRLARPSKVR
jgi:hypothetical protein